MNIALILSGGTGTRLGCNIPKQYIEVNDKMIICYCLETIAANSRVDCIQIVADEVWHSKIAQALDDECLAKLKGFSLPGANRQLSIYNGLTDIRTYADDDSYVLIHDAARPLLKNELIDACFDAVGGKTDTSGMNKVLGKKYDGVLPVVPIKDTVYMSEDKKHISSLIDRDKIYGGQAPEVFLLGRYYKANEELVPDKILKINGSTEPAVMAGMDIVMIEGDENNFKITTQADLDKFKYMIKTRGF